MMQTLYSKGELRQLEGSIEKLFHYLAVYVKTDTRVTVTDGTQIVFDHEFKVPKQVIISPTLYTRIDDCHGAGNCCRVPFDLIYTDYDYKRILDFDYDIAVRTFGETSADGFAEFAELLLESLVSMKVTISSKTGGVHMQSGQAVYETTESRLWVQRNTVEQQMSGQKSCPYLTIGDDRYFCGIHPFKPLHCWYPHMTVRATPCRNGTDGDSISIGRIQYGRNHNFGCPVKFTAAVSEVAGSDLFHDAGQDGDKYFASGQYQSDVDKLEWTSRSAKSLGFTAHKNLAVGLHETFADARGKMMALIDCGKPESIVLWTKRKR